MDLNGLLRSVTDAITRHNDPDQPEYPQENLVGYVRDLFLGHGDGNGRGRVRPASEDPYGDPAERQFAGRRVRPASEDPYGDPADQ